MSATLAIEGVVIGYYKRRNSQDCLELTILEFLQGIQSGNEWKRHTEWVRECDPDAPKDQRDERTGEAINEYDRRKSQSACVTISGVFDGPKTKENFRLPSCLMAIDLDKLGNRVDEMQARLAADPFVLAVFKSIGGKGLCVIFRINPDRWEDSFDGISEYLIAQYGLVNKQFDKSSRNINRLRYVSYDPAIYWNFKARLFAKYPAKATKKAKIGGYVHTDEDIEFVIAQIEQRQVEFHDTDGDWVRMGLALASKYDESGRDYFQRISQYRHDYDADYTDKVYAYLCKNKRGDVTIATFYYLCKQAGLDIMTQRTKLVVSMAAMYKKQGGTIVGTVDTLQKMEGITPAEAEPIVKQVFESREAFDTEETLFDQLDLFLRQNYPMRLNLITGRIEDENGKIIKSVTFNTIYFQAQKVVTEKLNFADFDRFINSEATPSYHPILDFFGRHKNVKPFGAIDALCDSIIHDMHGENVPKNYVNYFVCKWLIGLISSIHGKYSPLVLVLTGPQNTGKTEWFRMLLPEELRGFYAESRLDRGKDDEIAMCRKWILMNDEFGGKTVVEHDRFKELSSKQIITVREPYRPVSEDLQRIAVLCGTSNSKTILSDPTGNRRILPVFVKRIDFEAYNAVDKTEVLMEAYHRWKAGETMHLSDESIKRLNESTVDFEEVDLLTQKILNHFAPIDLASINAEWKSIADIHAALQVNVKQVLNINQLSIKLEQIGFTKYRRKVSGKHVIGFYVTDPKTLTEF